MADSTTSNCAKAWGHCMRDPRCQDTQCPEHPTARCSTCKGGHCYTPQACQQPMAEIPVRIERRLFAQPPGWLPNTNEGWSRFIRALLGFGGFVFFTGSWLRRFFP